MPNKIKQLSSRTGFVILLLAACAAVLAVHWPTLSAQALSSDDSQYLAHNFLVQNPSWTSAKIFLTEVLEPSTVEGYYQPLPMISLMLDYAFGGRTENLRSFHRTDLILHVANTALVITLLYLLFGSPWLAAALGLLFGLHPMTIESVAWVSERKTLLAAFFTFLCLVAYICYTRKPGWKLYLGCLAAFILALMSKPTSTPLPILMLLLDYWPLNRLKWRVVLEKLPFFAIGFVSAIITYLSQSGTSTVGLPGERGVTPILLVICHNIFFYPFKIFWPVNVFSYYSYPSPFTLSNPLLLAAVIGLLMVVIFLILSLRWTRAILTGLLIFFIAILPTMQVIGFSNVIASDKFIYIPSIGLLMLYAAFLRWLCSRSSSLAGNIIVSLLVVVLAVTEAVAVRHYLPHWRNSVTLCEYLLKRSPDESTLYNQMGFALESQGKRSEAVGYYRRAIKISPNFSDAYGNLAVALRAQDRLDEAVENYRQALKFEPNDVVLHYNLANTLQQQGRLDEAVSHYRQVIKFRPRHADALNNLANVLAEQGKFDEAIDLYRRVLEIKPGDVVTYNNLGAVLSDTGKVSQAVDCYSKALRIMPDFMAAHYNLINVFIVQGKLDELAGYYHSVLNSKREDAEIYYRVGEVLVEKGKNRQAVEYFQKSAKLAPAQPAPLFRLAKILATYPDPNVRDPNGAVNFAKRAAELTNYQDPMVLEILAQSYAANNQFDLAVKTVESALNIISSEPNSEFAARLRDHLQRYQNSKP
jgi:tetratricopeptide (TPR) repeat protein